METTLDMEALHTMRISFDELYTVTKDFKCFETSMGNSSKVIHFYTPQEGQ